MPGASEKHAMQQSWKRNQKGPSGGKGSPPAPVPPPLYGFEVWLPLPPGTVASLVAECPAPCIPRSCVSPTRTILFVAVCGLDSDFTQLSCDSSEKRSWFLLLTSLGFGAVEFDVYLSIPVALVYFL